MGGSYSNRHNGRIHSSHFRSRVSASNAPGIIHRSTTNVLRHHLSLCWGSRRSPSIGEKPTPTASSTCWGMGRENYRDIYPCGPGTCAGGVLLVSSEGVGELRIGR